MAQIQVLKQQIADLIAAGEVVSRPASVVKELVENSIDAGSSSITVEINSGGMVFIRVTDDGSGIAPDDIKTAFLRHATSKLFDAKGLEAIKTLGFRGEALAAIAAVSHIEILSRLQAANEGVSMTISAGEVQNLSPVGSPVGTTVIVKDLFFNTPARLKFMKTDRAEGSAVSSVVLRAALSRPDISFHFIKDGITQFHAPGDSSLSSCIYSLLGRDFEAGLTEVRLSDEAVTVNGYVSKPEFARGNRNSQYFFVNGRAVRSTLLQSALEQAYRNTLPAGRFPACVLYIETNPANVDVNVHPAKVEVKFVSDKQVFDGVYYGVLSVLESKKPAEESPNYGNFTSIKTEDFQSLYVSEPVRNYTPFPGFNHTVKTREVLSEKIFMTEPSCETSFVTSPDFYIIGEAFNVYIIVEYHDDVWFIDKHAVHERLHFDALKSGKYEPMSETLITPVVCRVGHEDVAVLQEHNEFLTSLGFSIESFGEDTVAVRHIPADIDIGDVEFVLYQLCMQLAEGDTTDPLNLDQLYKIIACKAAIKAGSVTDTKELEALVEQVLSDEITYCPHGRPVSYKVSKATLEKNIGRV